MNKDYIKNVILFLEENEQYGDDWSEEIKELKKLIAYADITEEEAQVITNGDKKLKEMLDECNWLSISELRRGAGPIPVTRWSSTSYKLKKKKINSRKCLH